MIHRNENFKEYIKLYPITTLIVALNLIMFLCTSILGGLKNPSLVYEFGGIINSKINSGEYYRIVSYAFIHNGFSHILFNMGAILLLAPPLEKVLGKTQYLFFFFICIISTFIFIYFATSGGVGASGFCFGLLGLYLYLIFFRKNMVDVESKKVLTMFIILSWITTVIIPDVSISGHLGGFLAGFLSGFIFKFTPYILNEKSIENTILP